MLFDVQSCDISCIVKTYHLPKDLATVPSRLFDVQSFDISCFVETYQDLATVPSTYLDLATVPSRLFDVQSFDISCIVETYHLPKDCHRGFLMLNPLIFLVLWKPPPLDLATVSSRLFDVESFDISCIVETYLKT